MKPFGQGDCEMHLPQNKCFGMTFTGALLDCKKGSEQSCLEMYLSFRMTSWNALIFTAMIVASGKCLCPLRLSKELVNVWDHLGQVFETGFAKGSDVRVCQGASLGIPVDRFCSKVWVLRRLWFAGESWPGRRWQDESTRQKCECFSWCRVKPEHISEACG